MSVLNHSLIADLSRCTGCKICELACSFEKEQVFNPSLSRIKIFRQYMMAVYVPMVSVDCDLCGKCITSCPTDAIKFIGLDAAALLRRDMNLNQFICPNIPARLGKGRPQ